MAASTPVNLTYKTCRKLNKKVLRCRKYLETSENLIIYDNPTKILCVQNGGLGNSVSREDILEIFSQYGCVQDIIMIPRKPYCFVCFDNCDSSLNAKKKTTGYLLREGIDPSQNVVLYPFFVSQAASYVCPVTDLPSGLVLVKDFITADMEHELLKIINFDGDSRDAGSSLKHRQVKHYGYEFNYEINNVDPRKPLKEGIPEICHEFLKQALDSKLIACMPDQLTVNQYLAGQGIPPHVDTPSAFEDGIVSLSCGSQVIMDFRHPDGRCISVLLPRRSLLVMCGESRFIWSHGITPRKTDIVSLASGGLTLVARETRTSFTFRKLDVTYILHESVHTIWLTENEEISHDLFTAIFVLQVYEQIGAHFSDTRYKPWPQIAQFLLAQEPGSLFMDTGCGNGKYFGINKNIFEIGSDRSEKLAAICRERRFQVFRADVRAIPVRDGAVDVGLCIAVIHHLSTENRRKQAVQELIRILRPGGSVLIYVWAKEQEKDRCKSKYLKENKQPIQECSSPQEPSDSKQHKELPHGDDSGQEELSMMCSNDAGVKIVSHFTPKPENNVEGEVSVSAAEKSKIADTGDRGNQHLTSVPGAMNNRFPDTQKTSILQVHINRTDFKSQDVLVPWQLQKARVKKGQQELTNSTSSHETLHRFYHVFEEGELEKLCAGVNGCIIEKSYYDQGNWCVVLRKM
ncbi:hypothetical protein C0Q70_06210 [Pomacea canaliculata]|uniref:tRNA (carboxymethyluridine(34)-5-O)-methyltransferase n=1 Tax=Pomacea canaliculata TaxID=400727 RepID=A0A2T7PND2_POMCA|nr:hypothetical protein C0Q70_06210 [Pomacea canaliculata]